MAPAARSLLRLSSFHNASIAFAMSTMTCFGLWTAIFMPHCEVTAVENPQWSRQITGAPWENASTITVEVRSLRLVIIKTCEQCRISNALSLVIHPCQTHLCSITNLLARRFHFGVFGPFPMISNRQSTSAGSFATARSNKFRALPGRCNPLQHSLIGSLGSRTE